MINTTEIYYQHKLVYFLSNTAPSMSPTGEAIRNALREELEFWRRNYSSLMEHVQVISGELTDLRIKYPFDNGGGQIVENPPPQVRQMLGSVISAIEIARAVSKKDNMDVLFKPRARPTSVLRAVSVEEEERPVKKSACDVRTPITTHLTIIRRCNMMLIQLYYRDDIVWDLCYPGDFALHQQLLDITKKYVARLTAEYPYLVRQVTNVDMYFDCPLKRFRQTNSYGQLTACVDDEVRATVITMQGAIALAIAHWEADHEKDGAEQEPPPAVVPSRISPSETVVAPQEIDFREIDHPHDDYWEGREDPY